MAYRAKQDVLNNNNSLIITVRNFSIIVNLLIEEGQKKNVDIL